MLDEHSKEGYTEVIPPYAGKPWLHVGTGQYQNSRKILLNLDTNYVIIPTAEVP